MLHIEKMAPVQYPICMDMRQYFDGEDLRKTPSKKGIHFEQKITPDLLWCVSQVLLEITGESTEKEFTDEDVRNSDSFNVLMKDYFSKAEQSDNTENEYNKVSSYQLGFLVYANILEETSTHPKIYKIKNLELLKDLAGHELTALKFLICFVDKFLSDNELLSVFKEYEQNQTQTNYIKAKEAYWQWARVNTHVRTPNPTHSNRVFNKIFNIYAYGHDLNGESGAHVTEGKCPYNFLVYKRINFRDESMPRGLSRNEFLELQDREATSEQRERQVKKEIRERHPNGEILDSSLGYSNNQRFMGHHILPQNEYRQFKDFRENIIMLTPDQHFAFAHNQGTQAIDVNYQIHCLINKLTSIEDSVNNRDGFYSTKCFVDMLNTIYGTNLDINTSIESLRNFLTSKLS